MLQNLVNRYSGQPWMKSISFSTRLGAEIRLLRALGTMTLAFFGHSLSAATYTDGQNLVYTYTVGTPTASVTGSTGATGSITIPATITIGTPAVTYDVTAIGASAFAARTAITSITIPTSVTSIGNLAFSGCTGLTSMTIPSSVTSLGTTPFYMCTALTAISVDSSNSTYSSSDGLLYNKLGTTLLQYPAGKSGSAYTITSGVTTIGANSFSGSTMLTSVTIPSSVISISTAPFISCNALNSITVASANGYFISEGGVLFN
jgi:hypothetical protein